MKEKMREFFDIKWLEAATLLVMAVGIVGVLNDPGPLWYTLNIVNLISGCLSLSIRRMTRKQKLMRQEIERLRQEMIDELQGKKGG